MFATHIKRRKKGAPERRPFRFFKRLSPKVTHFARSVLDEISEYERDVVGLGSDQLEVTDGGIVKDVAHDDVLAELGLEVEPVALGGNDFESALALLELLKKALRILNVLNLHIKNLL